MKTFGILRGDTINNDWEFSAMDVFHKCYKARVLGTHQEILNSLYETGWEIKFVDKIPAYNKETLETGGYFEVWLQKEIPE